MTEQQQQHPITPPPELVEQWVAETWHEGTPVRVAASDLHIATQAARWGADQELRACIEWITERDWTWTSAQLRAARRRKPPSLKEQALEELAKWREVIGAPQLDTIRRALEQLDD